MENQNILKENSKLNVSLKSSNSVKDNVDMDQQHQVLSEKENFNPKSLKEIASADSETDLSKPDQATTNEGYLKSANSTFDQTSDDESYISTNDNLSFLTDGFNNIKLDGEAQQSITALNSTEQAQPLEMAANKTLTESSPTNTTFTEEKSPIDVIDSGEIVENACDQKTNNTFTEEEKSHEVEEEVAVLQNCDRGGHSESNEEEYQQEPKDIDTLDEITAAFANANESNTELDQKEHVEILSPILPPEAPNACTTDQELHDINITSSITFDNSNEENISDPVMSEMHQEVCQESPPAAFLEQGASTDEYETIAFSSTFAATSSQAYLTAPTPMEVDETFSDDIKAPTENEGNPNENESQQTFEEKFLPGLEFNFKTPETLQQPLGKEDLHNNMNSGSTLDAEAEAKHDENEFKIPNMPSKRLSAEDFQSGATYNFGNFDLDILQEFGNTPSPDYCIGRDSVLLRFDPLLEKIAPVDTQINQRITPTTTTRLASTEEEDEHYSESQNLSDKPPQDNLTPVKPCGPSREISPPLPSNAENSAMKDLDQGNETIESLQETKEFKELSDSNNQQLLLLQQQKTEYENKMTELESQLRKEAEIKEEALLKRITEKEKQMAKMNNVVEAYEKAIAELIAEKEQLIQSYEKKCLDLKNDSETNSHHLASLESTFSDLHAKYERTKQIASELKEREEVILTDRKSLQDALKSQEARYEKMKTHAMSQLEIANTKLAEMQRNQHAETTKLKAQLKKEEISRASITEQLNQKSKENAELVKICDELIGNHGLPSQNA